MKDRWLTFGKCKDIGLFFLWVLTLSGMLLGVPAAARAQALPPVASIHSLDASQFPTVTFKLDIHDADGAFLPGLQAKDLVVLENDAKLVVDELTLTRARSQVVVALNPAMVMVNQYNKSSVYEKIQTSLQEWAKKQPLNTADDFNLAVNDGMLALHLSQPADMVKAIEAYQPNLYTVQTNLNSLNTAIEMATDPNIPSDTKKEIIYISPAPAPAFLTGLPALIERVKKAGVRVDVWLVSASPVVEARGAVGLKQLAEATGGQYFIFTGRETLPDPDTYLDEIRNQYLVTYQSAITLGGEQAMKLRIQQGIDLVDSNVINFSFDIRPPNPILLNPPASIMMPVISVNGNSTNQAGFDQLIRILVEFPDGHTRPIKSSQLYVDGKLAAENTAAPFDEFYWRLTEENENKRHMLQVKIEDSLGLTSISAASPVDILENPASRTLIEEIASSERLLTASAIAAALLAILILLWLTSRRNRFKVAAPGRGSSSRDAASPDQITRPVRPIETRAMKQISATAQTPTVPIKFRAPQAGKGTAIVRPPAEQPAGPPISKRQISFAKPACLKRLDQANKPIPGGEFLINRAEITIGSSPSKSILVIDLPSVDGLHARLVRTLDDNYFLADCGSVGGTWVNFAPVSSRGVHLVDGDLVHFGRTPFRFELGKPDDFTGRENKLKK